MKHRVLFFLLVLWGWQLSSTTTAQSIENIRFGGYSQIMPLQLNVDFPEPIGNQSYRELRMQQRLNLFWEVHPSIFLTAQSRTRFFTGDLVASFPGYAQSIDVDDGYLNLSTMFFESRKSLLHFNSDRLFAEWRNETWNVRAGRQRINWGINMITNPNDLFNIYSFFEFDYPERPGADALRIQYHTDWATRAEVAFAPQQDLQKSVAAFLYGFNRRGYDIQLISGYFRNQLAIGGGWAGNLGSAGFKGETMLFYDLDTSEDEVNLVIALSADYMFENALFMIVEGLYNQRGGSESTTLAADGISASNPSFSRWQLTTQLSYPVSPVLDISLAGVWFVDEQIIFLSPSISRSLTQNTDLRFTGQYIVGREASPLSSFGNLMALSVRWNF